MTESLPNRRDAFDLSDQAAVITGGGTGLGFAMARCLAAAGAHVVLIGRREVVLTDACAQLGSHAWPLAADITRLTEAPSIIDRAEELAGPISILINNAGVHLKKSAEATTDQEFASVLYTHLHASFALTREAGARMVERGAGSVLFTASMTSLIGMPQVVAYAAAKSALLGVVRTLAVEWGGSGVRVNAIAPGWIASDMLEAALHNDERRRQRILRRTPLGRFGEPDDVGWAAVYLCSPAARFINGVVLPIDGGAVVGF